MATEAAAKVKDAFKQHDKVGLGFIRKEDLVSILAKLGITVGYDWLLDDVAKDEGGALSYVDFVDAVFGLRSTSLVMVSKHAATVGDEVGVLLPNREGVVVEVTTSDAKLRLPDGNEVWFDIEEIEGEAISLHECRPGSKVRLQDGSTCSLSSRTTTDLQLQLADGSKVWRPIEDCQIEANHIEKGRSAKLLTPSQKGRVINRTTTDALVRLQNGVEVWVDVDEIAPIATAPSAESVARLKDIFDKCDASNDGKISKIELIKICRSDKSIADFFGLPSRIHQEDGSRDEMEKRFQAIDTDSDRNLTWEEFRRFYLDCKIGAFPPPKAIGEVTRAITN
jgi:Ca2+-binding EF-hand superfamily protein